MVGSLDSEWSPDHRTRLEIYRQSEILVVKHRCRDWFPYDSPPYNDGSPGPISDQRAVEAWFVGVATQSKTSSLRVVADHEDIDAVRVRKNENGPVERTSVVWEPVASAATW